MAWWNPFARAAPKPPANAPLTDAELGAISTEPADIAALADVGTWIPANSSWIHSYRYDESRHELTVRFKDKKTGAIRATCLYENVPQILWAGLLGAQSKGTYFHATGLYSWPYTTV